MEIKPNLTNQWESPTSSTSFEEDTLFDVVTLRKNIKSEETSSILVASHIMGEHLAGSKADRAKFPWLGSPIFKTP